MTDAAQPNLFTRDDTFFGVCEGLGEDLSVHANWLRLAFAGAFFFAPALVTGVYVVLGMVVALSRWMFPVPVAAGTDAIGEELASAPKASAPIAAGLFGARQDVSAKAADARDRDKLPLAA